MAQRPGLAERLSGLRTENWTHVAALAAAMGRAAPSGAPAADASATAGSSIAADDRSALAALAAAERAAEAQATAACLAAPARYAELLGSIAACRATHVEVLT